jgi:hypothetical protein
MRMTMRMDDNKPRANRAKVERWKAVHHDAFEEHNRFIEENGIWSEEFCSWGRSDDTQSVE